VGFLEFFSFAPSSEHKEVSHMTECNTVVFVFFPAAFTTPRAILTGHDCEVTCVSVCAELGLVISGCKGEAARVLEYVYIVK